MESVYRRSGSEIGREAELKMKEQEMDEAHTDVSWYLDIKDFFPINPETGKREKQKKVVDPENGVTFILELVSDYSYDSVLITAPSLWYNVGYQGLRKGGQPHGTRREDGFHVYTHEQEKWDYAWKRMMRALLNDAVFFETIKRAQESGARLEGSRASDAEAEKLKQLLDIDLIVEDAERFVSDMRDWWDIAHLRRRGKFPDEVIPMNYTGKRPADKILPLEEYDALSQKRCRRRCGYLKWKDSGHTGVENSGIEYAFQFGYQPPVKIEHIDGKEVVHIQDDADLRGTKYRLGYGKNASEVVLSDQEQGRIYDTVTKLQKSLVRALMAV